MGFVTSAASSARGGGAQGERGRTTPMSREARSMLIVPWLVLIVTVGLLMISPSAWFFGWAKASKGE